MLEVIVVITEGRGRCLAQNDTAAARTLFSMHQRLANHAFSNAHTWPEIQQVHQTLVDQL